MLSPLNIGTLIFANSPREPTTNQYKIAPYAQLRKLPKNIPLYCVTNKLKVTHQPMHI